MSQSVHHRGGLANLLRPLKRILDTEIVDTTPKVASTGSIPALTSKPPQMAARPP
jgi:hypothetical protein